MQNILALVMAADYPTQIKKVNRVPSKIAEQMSGAN